MSAVAAQRRPPTRAPHVARARPPQRPLARRRALKLLVVDDDPDTLEALEMLLTDAGAEVRTATSVRDALSTWTRWVPDVLLSDIAMPAMDGYALIREVRALPAEYGGHVPAIALTAFASANDRARAEAAGFQVHLAKPFDPNLLVAAVAKLAARPGGGK